MAVVNSSRFNTKESLEWAVKRQLDYWSADVLEVSNKVTQEVAREAVKKLKAESPKGTTGKYSKGWTYKMERGRLRVGAVIYGKHGTYQLAHLLEHGHAKRGGGREPVKGIEHIKPVEEWVNQEIIDRTIERIERLNSF